MNNVTELHASRSNAVHQSHLRRLASPHRVQDMFVGRDVTFHLPLDIERRLKRVADKLVADDPDTIPEGEIWPQTLTILIGAMLDRGLCESEEEDGLHFHGLTGTYAPYPKRPRLRRLKRAWKELRG